MISFLSVFPPYRGGIATFSDSLYRELSLLTKVRPFGFKKLYPSLLFPGTSQKLEKSNNTYALEVFHPYQPFNWRQVAEQIMEENPDYLLYSYWHPFFAPGFRKVLQHSKKINPVLKTVGIAHNIMPHEYFPLKKYLTERLLDKTDLTVLLSEQTESDFKELHTESQYMKLFHPIYELERPEADVDQLRTKYGFHKDDQIVLFLGLVRDYKGVDILIEALNEILPKRERIKPLIVGEFYTDKSKLLDQIDGQVKDRYTIRDEFVSDKTMAELLTLSDLLVLPYKEASQSGVLANAIYFNLPALITDHPGLSEHLTHRHNGMICRPNDAQDLRYNIEAYFDEQLKEKLSRNLEPLKEELSWEKFASRLVERMQSL
ncbi:glycosyltransferase [Balneolaceae bacterium YR4-1]|uniref:Glycosyltransferase n=1 Tax=Halalkalibaculum roseum TaxID=2709311 RepID=A0A6M1ST39_9BACT|nr:glycosyltransferase [Halalkalibaculum roseum]